MKFEFPDFALIQEAGIPQPETANIFVRVSENESVSWPGAVVYIQRASRLLDHTYLKAFCRYSSRLGIGKREALRAIGKLFRRRKYFVVKNVTLHNHDEVAELLLSLAKEL